MENELATNFMKIMTDSYEYFTDASQRMVLYMDILRKRGNIYLDHLQKGQPPVLVFDYETIMDARTFERPVNYALVRILDRRDPSPTDQKTQQTAVEYPEEKRRRKIKPVEKRPSRPIVIMDPRAGHGPGIGGSKKDSQIGMSLDAGHPVYFMIFFTEPMPGQTLADVRNAQIIFIEEVRRRHPDSPKPAIIGNCQGGWAAALIGAERPELVGPMVFNGSPLSYWGGVEGTNPMRYLGGLLGGVWINSFFSDLGGGKFDGANLVSNFENLNPANTLWSKQYNVYAGVDTEEKRYLEFEKWWGGFYLMNKEEIHTIVDGLFVGNKLEQGEFELEEGRTVDLKHNNNPVVLFASFGDNITPPQQAYNWIIKTYGTVDEIKRRGQVIVYISHENIGHLGIFVSAKIARKEHKKIIDSFGMLDNLPPGLYYMKIYEDPETKGEYLADYVEKTMDDIMALDDGIADEDAFYPVRAVSQFNDAMYQCLISPWVRLFVTESVGKLVRQLHPLRTQRYLLSDWNPWMAPLNYLASMIKSGGNRRPVSEDNLFHQMEKQASDAIVNGLNQYRDIRDGISEQIFKAVYSAPWMTMLEPVSTHKEIREDELNLEVLRREDANFWRDKMTEGGFVDAVIRIFLLFGLADQEISGQGYEVMKTLVGDLRQQKGYSGKQIQEIIRLQTRIVQTDTDQAIETLPQLLPTQKQRNEALGLLRTGMNMLSREPDPRETLVVGRITERLQALPKKSKKSRTPTTGKSSIGKRKGKPA